MKKAYVAVDLYNREFRETAYRIKPEPDFSVSGYGVGLCLRF